ncbi:ATP-binding cassette domain-containing protein [Cytobacillus firmus]|uniref:ATP-binding cassette domain-containing protein n=1 Tax=Cytobacillus firmus TaxID=1399 RepID=UPI0018CCB1E6|nr:ABC transporter ATP-binding protein [Cytobacillus firmus]MBG9587215.1 hypothetical protein [Cytobacillus firmus]
MTSTITSYQTKLSVVYQDFTKFNLSVLENLTFKENTTDKIINKVHKILEIVGMNEYIDQLNNGLYSLLGRYFQGGNELSGGQWQKVALARGLYKNGDILILDEPSSALDPISEKMIFENILSKHEGTILFITHRLGIAALADKIVVMEKGHIVEVGNHDELLKNQGVYSRMYEAQTEWYTNEMQREKKNGFNNVG